jgi:hypothetical protein
MEKPALKEGQILEQINKARERDREEAICDPPTVRLDFKNRGRLVVVSFADGFVLSFPSSYIKELRDASPDEIRKGELTASGDAIHWNGLDAHYTIAGLLSGRFANRNWMQELGRIGGRSTSDKKADAARRNGKRGGRPPAGVTLGGK